MKRLLVLTLLLLGFTLFACDNDKPADPCANGHDFGAWTQVTAATCDSQGEEQRVCSRDASHKETRTIPALDHDFGAWTQTKAPTCTEKGLEERVCSRDASHKETREIEMINHNYVDGECTMCHQPDPDYVPPLERLDGFDTNLINPSAERAFRDGIDVMIEDFSTNGSQKYNSFLRVLADNQANPAPTSGDAAIYKIASGVYQFENYAAIGFRMRVVEGTIDLSNLVLALRGDDNYQLYEISLADALDIDGSALPRLTGEFQDFIICPNLSIEDDTTEYLLKDGTPSGVKVLDKYLGFHLYVKGDCSAILDIEEVFLYQTEKQMLDTFDRYDVGQADASVCWWRGSTGFIVKAGTNEGFVISQAELAGKANLVLNVLGDASQVTINGKAWSELKDNENKALAMPVNGAWHSLVINLANSGLEGDLTIVNSGLNVSQIFASDLETKPVVTEYPLISKYINIIDNFNRTQSGFDGDYDKASTNEQTLAAGLNYILSYNNGNMVNIKDGFVEFDATNLGENDYINFKEGKNNYQGEPYLVLLLKAVDGANFNNFRFNVGNGVVYYNNMFSAYGLHLPQAGAENYPYTDEEGYMWVIIDLEESNMEPNPNDGFVDFYYSGNGKLLIGAYFFAFEEGYVPEEEIKYEVVSQFDEPKAIADLSGYTYAGWINGGLQPKYLELTFTSESEVTMNSLRIEGANGAKWMKDGDLQDLEGNALEASYTINGELKLYVLVEGTSIAGNDIHIHMGANGETGGLTLMVKAYKEAEEAEEIKYEVVSQFDEPKVIADLSGYTYAGWINGGLQPKYLELTFTSESEVTMNSLRIEGANGAKWMKDGDLQDLEGNVLEASYTINGELKLYVLVEGTSIAGNDIHIHMGANGETGGLTLMVKAYKEIASEAQDNSPYKALMDEISTLL